MLEGLLAFLLELGLNLVGEVLAEAGFRVLASPFEDRPHPALAVLGYAVYGAVVGGLSTFVLTEHLIRDPTLAMANLVVSPIVAGLVMAGVGALRARRGQSLIRLDSFFYGWLFAAAFALTRYALLSS